MGTIPHIPLEAKAKIPTCPSGDPNRRSCGREGETGEGRKGASGGARAQGIMGTVKCVMQATQLPMIPSSKSLTYDMFTCHVYELL